MRGSVFSIALASTLAVVRAADGDLDSSFGSEGVVVTSVAGNDSATAMAIAPDGKIVLAGIAGFDVGLVRYLPDGMLDDSFGTGGIQTTTLGPLFQNVTAAAFVTGGKLLVGGSFFDPDPAVNNRDFAFARHLMNGDPDTDFGPNGTAARRFDLGAATNDSARGSAIDRQGRILLVGEYEAGWAVSRHLPTGEIDATFGNAGASLFEVGPLTTAAYAAAVQSDGKIVVAGGIVVDNTTTFALVRLTGEGQLDPSFGTAGIVSASFRADLRSVVVLPDDRIVAGGTAGGNMYFLRLLPDGAIDTSLGGIGAAAINFGDGHNDLCEAMVVQPDGKLLVAGSAERLGVNSMAVGRLLEDGSLDTTFGGVGGFLYQHEGNDTLGHAMQIDSEGRIVIVGGTGPGQTKDFYALRLLNSTAPPPTLAEWRDQQFGSPANAGLGADAADPDFDGVPNIVEYAFGLDPHVADSAQLPEFGFTDTTFGTQFNRPASVAPGEVIYGAQSTTDLGPASWQPVSNSGVGTILRFEVLRTGVPRQVMRLTVVPAAP